MKTQFMLTLALGSTLVLSSCGGDKAEEKEEPKNAIEALQHFADQAEENAKKEPVDPVDFRSLKELLPESMGSLARSDASGEKTGAMGFTISKAEAKYQDSDNNARISVEIIDTGGIAGVGAMAMAAWTMASIDKETDDGYERTSKIDGHKSYEKYNRTSQRGEINVMVSQRFIVNINGSNVTEDQLKDALSKIDIDQLEGLE
ncbi:hypothetical protein CLV98_106238 [Dyadobacter jejuensis]|uniref:Uncharacterized protein n=1 Tax=Dyadobacter jejuensis TaxID=1082580 RepID=A0A316AJA3_9BACT|nr:hypothetical protein [Dyadobacter jejuensis]PWJ57766.1 hypothetical protein CLV98_106238 [Dyadobacter jejuensis]